MRRTPKTVSRRGAALAAACAIGLGGLVVSVPGAMAEAPSPPPSVVVSIAPVHSLVAGVMAGVGEPTLLVKGGASPHTYALKPSDAAALSGAQIVFRIGPGLETFLDDPLETLARQADVVDLAGAPGVRLLPLREGGIWEAHDHGHEDGDAHADGATEAKAEPADAADHDHEQAAAAAAPDADHGHDHDAAADGSVHAAAPADAHADADAHGHGDGHDHGHGAPAHDAHDAHATAEAQAHAGEHDMHLWLDPRNAAAMTRAIVATLSDADPANADRYGENGAALEARLAVLDARLETELAPVRATPFIVFHDAYQYLDARYDLAAVGAITVSPDRAPGAQRMQEVRATIAERGAACVFTEPQFEPRAVSRLVEDTGVRTGVLDPDAAAAHAPGPDLYFELMDDLAASLVACLGGSG
jgi:zinc transport system substrate-binding protein